MSDVATRLDDALLNMGDPGREYDEAWSIQTDDTAAWASRKLKAAHDELSKIDAWAEREKTRIDAVAAEERRAHDRDADFFQAHLAVWLRDLIREGRAKKSLSLPGGKIALRSRGPKIEITDEGVALSWLREHRPDLVRVKESLDRAGLKKVTIMDGQKVVLVDTGEVLEFAYAEPQEDSVSFAPAEDTA